MHYALISDIHANQHALDAVLADIDRRSNIDAVYHLGDLVGYSAFPNEVVATLRSRGITGVAGNYDSTVAFGAEHCGCKSESASQEALAHISFAFTKLSVTSDTRAYLAALPFMLELRPRGGHQSRPRLVLVHGTPTLNTLYWTEDRSDEFCQKMADVVALQSGDIIAFGHTHKPWYRQINGIHFVNAGSVGRPKDGDPRAAYALVDVDDGETRVQFVRVPYDIDAAVAGIRTASLPEEFGDFLRAGGAEANNRTRENAPGDLRC